MLDHEFLCNALPVRVLLDTCILNRLYDHCNEDADEDLLDVESLALRRIHALGERVHLQLFVSPLSIAEVANTQDEEGRHQRLNFLLEMLTYWITTLDLLGDRARDGGSVRHRFKLTQALQQLEAELMTIDAFRRDPVDRLLIIQCSMGACDAFLTTDEATIWVHRAWLLSKGVRVLKPTEYWALLQRHVPM